MKTKKKKYNKDAIPNAWVDENSNLYFNAQGGAQSDIADFLNKDASTLKYFWQWTNDDKNATEPADTSSSNPSIIRIDPAWAMSAVPGYKYTKNKFDHINNNDQINLYSLGKSSISTSEIQQLSLDNTQDLEVTSVSYGSYDENPSETPTSTGQGEGFGVTAAFVAAVNKTEEINVAGEFTNSITNTTSSTTSTENTQSQEFGIGVELSYEYQTGVPGVSQSTWQAKLSTNYNESWSETQSVSYTEEDSTTNTGTVSISYSSTVTPTATTTTDDDDSALSIDVYNQKYTIEAGDEVVVDTTFAKGTYYAELDAPYLLDGPVGQYTIGTATTNAGDGKIYTEAWQGGGKPQTIAGNIGQAAKWATEYNWQGPFFVSTDTQITQYEKDDSQAYVQNASIATTGVGAYFVINTYKNGELLEGGSSSRSLRSVHKEDENGTKVTSSAKVNDAFKDIGINKLANSFDAAKINDLSEDLEKTAERLKLSEDAAETLPGYFIEQKLKGDAVVILPDRVNYLDLSKSKGKSLILTQGGRGRVLTGSGNDIIATVKESHQTIRTGSGADIVYSLGNGDNIELGDGKDSVYALGEQAFIKLGNGKNESVFLGDKSKVQLFDFKPGSTRLGATYLGKNGERIDNFKPKNFRLDETSMSNTFKVRDRNGDNLGSISLQETHHSNENSLWLDYALKYRSGKLIDKLISNRGTITLSKQDILLDDFGSHLKSFLINDLNTLSEEGKKVFLKRGFAEGSKHYELDYSHEGGKKISDSLTNWISSTVDDLRELYSDKERSLNFDSIDNIRSMISTAVSKAAGGRHGNYWLAGKAPEDQLGSITSAIAENFN